MLFVVQITILAETVEADALFALFFVALLVFGFIVLKELARRFAESQFSERLRGRS